METATRVYSSNRGWNAPLPALDSPSTLVLAFASPDLEDLDSALAKLAVEFPNSIIAGCSTAGEIADDEIYEGTLTVGILRFERGRIRSATAEIRDPHASAEAGSRVAHELAEPDLQGILVFSDGVNVNGSRLAQGLNTAIGASVVVTGGLAADEGRFEQTFTIHGPSTSDRSIVAVGLYGGVTIDHGFQGGWDIFGPQRRVTKASGATVYELDGEPALDLYERYLGKLAADLPGSGLLFPLAIWEDDPHQQLVRTLLAVDHDERTLTFAGDIPEGSWAQLMQANFDRLVSGAEAAASIASANRTSGGFAMAVSCVGRKLVLGERVHDEVTAAHAALPAGAVQVGFYSNGELSPDGAGTCDLHNQTMTMTLISED